MLMNPAKILIESRSNTIARLIDIIDQAYFGLELWSSESQSLLIESMMIWIPIGQFVIREVPKEKCRVVDGTQRLTAITNFLYHGRRLNGLRFWPELNNMSFVELPKSLQKRIEEVRVNFYTIKLGTGQEELDELIKRFRTCS